MNEETKKALFDSYCLGRDQAFDIIIEFLASIKNNSKKNAEIVFAKFLKKEVE